METKQPMNIEETIIRVNGDADAIPLADFFAINEDGFSSEEIAEIIAALERGEKYVGGGGAAAEFILELA